MRRRARGPEERTHVKRRRWRNRQRVFIAAAFLTIGMLVTICCAVLER